MNKEIFKTIPLDDISKLYYSDKIKEFDFSEIDFQKIWDTHPEEFHTVKMYGKEILTPRWQQAYGKNYNYSGSRNNALPIPEIFKKFLKWSRENIDDKLNGLLVNWYDGKKNHYIGPHRDDIRDLSEGTPIVTISLGQERVFRMRKYGEKGFKDITIRNGGIIIIPWKTNLNWTHEVPNFKKYDGKRISVTLRAYL
ncbi:alpha-ketoglutarate-dependent dioxygenase AlkB [Tenacibaculum sp. M341]|uniref:alpha-ketoglutarate-dependent dioxygenase AlkB n=1 Tax=Tenacibaculum sp. M341 TaxID=2530339 RepID=UPI00104774B4|nr:alpha-ketoglutarate-dependent dioxygenase AlkB [Tenacibaculum sp. M341]TCI92182.1 2OG-Fe(II) oxygenase [Tenacibaculum sp. M341]